MNQRTNLLDLDRSTMERFFADIGEKTFRASQVIKWIHHSGITEFQDMTNLGLSLRDKLNNIACINPPEIISEQISEDDTHKWLIKIDSGQCVETVFIPEKDRGTLCVSSQVGCPLDCSFCSTGKQGFNRNLNVAEIIGQVWMANYALKHFETGQRIISNVVMMGMGEPLLNFDNVIKAMNIMMDDLAYGLGRKRVTLSTSGIIPGIKKLGQTSKVSLAVSLHTADNALRNTLVPINKKYPVEELIQACREYAHDQPGETITFEYVMLADVNDSLTQAKALATLLKDLPAKVNLIPFNPFPGTEYKRSDPVTIDRFRDILVNAGIITITRKTRGEDIDAACGQLVGKVIPRAKQHQNVLMENRV